MKQEIQLIQQVLDQAVKSGVIANLEAAALIWRAWGTIKYKIEMEDGTTNGNNGN